MRTTHVGCCPLDCPDACSLTVTVTDLPIPNDDPPQRAELYLANTRDDLIRAALTNAVPSLVREPGRSSPRQVSGRIER